MYYVDSHLIFILVLGYREAAYQSEVSNLLIIPGIFYLLNPVVYLLYHQFAQPVSCNASIGQYNMFKLNSHIRI